MRHWIMNGKKSPCCNKHLDRNLNKSNYYKCSCCGQGWKLEKKGFLIVWKSISDKMELYNEDGKKVFLIDVINWWLEHFEGLEHLTEGSNMSPETWYTINTILRRSIEKIKKTSQWLKMEESTKIWKQWLKENTQKVYGSKYRMIKSNLSHVKVNANSHDAMMFRMGYQYAIKNMSKWKKSRFKMGKKIYICLTCQREFDTIPPLRNNECRLGYIHKIVVKSKLQKLIIKRERGHLQWMTYKTYFLHSQ